MELGYLLVVGVLVLGLIAVVIRLGRDAARLRKRLEVEEAQKGESLPWEERIQQQLGESEKVYQEVVDVVTITLLEAQDHLRKKKAKEVATLDIATDLDGAPEDVEMTRQCIRRAVREGKLRWVVEGRLVGLP